MPRSFYVLRPHSIVAFFLILLWAFPGVSQSLVPSTDSSGWTLGVTAAMSGDDSGSQHISGLIAMTVPLGSTGERPLAQSSSQRDGSASPGAEPESLFDEPRLSTQESETPAADSLDSGEDMLLFGASELELSGLHSEFARSLVRHSLRQAGLVQIGPRLAALGRRARYSAALPELRLRGGRSTDESLRVAPTVADPERYTRSGGADYLLEARVSWRLDRLIFSRSEVALERIRESRRQSEMKLTRDVLRVLFQWYGAVLQIARPDLLPEQRMRAAIKRAEARATLEVLSGGWFDEEKAGFKQRN